jgi:nucleotide-binding universal stress UspA family protein
MARGIVMKDLILNLSTSASDNAVEYAISVAREFDAHLAAVAFAYEAITPAMTVDGVPPVWFDEMLKEAEASAKIAVDKFTEASRRSGISAEAQSLTATYAGAAQRFSQIARRFDLAIVRQSEADKETADPLILQAALFDSGRPLLALPYIQKGGIMLNRVMVCWDGSRSAARAVGDAMPFLKRAKAIEVVVVGDRVKSGDTATIGLVQHFDRHGVKAQVKEIIASDVDVGNMLLSHAADSSADFMVMGGYGHSRLREFVLGGVTRTILATMTIPTLMSH